MKTVLLVMATFLLMSSVGVYAGTIAETGPQGVSSPNTGPLVIGWTLNGGELDGVTVTWSPVVAGVYTIEATVGTSSSDTTANIFTPLTSTAERTDFVPIAGVKPEDLHSVNVIIVES